MAKLFEGGVKDESNADIGWMHNRSNFYSQGYKNAARELSRNFEGRGTREKDTLVFPVIFLYRQYIELELKDIIRGLDLKLQNSRSDKILERHRLLSLWDESISQYKKFIELNKVGLVFTSENCTKERSVVKQFDQLDQESFAFRYAMDKSGKNNLERIDYISVNNFKENIELVVKYLEDMIETLCHASE